jgi:hypothetical protein
MKLKMQREALEKLNRQVNEMTTQAATAVPESGVLTQLWHSCDTKGYKWMVTKAENLLESIYAPVAQSDRASAF